jgi:hypothetical protein
MESTESKWKCEYCAHTYKYKTGLTYHQKNGKKCLLIQDGLKLEESKEKSLKEDYTKQLDKCKNTTISMQRDYDEIISRQDRQHETLKSIHQKEIEDLKSAHQREIEKLKMDGLEKERKIIDDYNEKIQTMLLQMASKPRTTTINNNNKILNMSTLNTDQEEFERYFNEKSHEINTIDDLVDNLVVKFTDENGHLQYICTDPSRNMFKFKDKNNVIQKDPNAVNLISIIQQPLNRIMKHKETGLLKILGDHNYNNTYEQQSAEESFNSLYEMKNLSKKESNTLLCKGLASKCS